ncbi:MAG: hypothetical protein MUE56_04550 [Ignavibacteria bacterium]|nr:hypothetical protein [Ignavibacteria bacterium]
MKHINLIAFILFLFILSACGKSKQELIIGEWEIKSPKKPDIISNLKLNPDYTGILIRPHSLLNIKEIPLNWSLDGSNLIMIFHNTDGKEVTGDTVEILNITFKTMHIRKGVKEDVLARIK